MMRLIFEQTSYSRDDRRLLGPITLEWHAQGVTAIIGANGAGKSLFLELAHGITQPSQGRVSWDKQNAHASKSTRGFVFQNRMIMHRSVANNVALPLLATRQDRHSIRAQVDHALKQVALNQKADQPAATLSGGEMQRMALARALLHKPKVLLLDEPTSQLDPHSCTLFETRVMQTAKTGTAILWVTHNLRQARRYADHIILLSDGAVVEYCKAHEFFSHPKTTQGKVVLSDASYST